MKPYRAPQYRAPSHKTLVDRLRLDRDVAIKVRRIIRGTLDPATVPATQEWIDQCYHRPNDLELRMHAIDSLLGTFGVEVIPPNFLPPNPQAVYCNTGDTYADTIIYSYDTDSFRIGSWGDYVERNRIEE